MNAMRSMSRYGRLTIPAVLALLLFTLAAAPAVASPASVKGLVTDDQGQGVGGVRVYVMEKVYPWGEDFVPQPPGPNWDWEPMASALTKRDGSYTVALRHLKSSGDFRVFFVPGDRETFAMEAYPDAAVPEDGADVYVEPREATRGIDVTLDPANRIQGHMYDARSRWDASGNEVDPSLWQGLEGVHVFASFQGYVRLNSHLGEEPLADAYTDEYGFYSIPGFKAPYPFFVYVGDDDGTAPQYVDRVIKDPTSDSFPDGVKVLNGWLQPDDFVNLQGRLVAQQLGGSPEPVPNATINVWARNHYPVVSDDYNWVCEIETDAEGVFSFSSNTLGPDLLGMAEPEVLLEFGGSDVLPQEFYDNAATLDDAQGIAVPLGFTSDIGDWVLGEIPITGDVGAWDHNGYGQTNVPEGLGDVMAIGGGAWHSLVLVKSD